MTVIAAVMARSYSPDMFADLDLWPVREYDKPTGVTTLTFDGELDGPTVAAIRARMTSKNDADQAARANLATLAADPETCACCSAVIGYLLGET